MGHKGLNIPEDADGCNVVLACVYVRAVVLDVSSRGHDGFEQNFEMLLSLLELPTLSKPNLYFFFFFCHDVM